LLNSAETPVTACAANSGSNFRKKHLSALSVFILNYRLILYYFYEKDIQLSFSLLVFFDSMSTFVR